MTILKKPQIPFLENALLAALPDSDLSTLVRGADVVSLKFGEVLYKPGSAIRHVYFPTSGVVSLLTIIDKRKALEVGLIGNEGLVGVALALGVKVSPVLAIVQGDGSAVRISATRLVSGLGSSLPLQRALYRFSHFLTSQISQTAACNRFHTVGGRLARWLLMTADRVGSNHFRITHEFLADMLGVRRAGVSEACNRLKKMQLIHYTRGDLTILDRKRLTASACSCYEVMHALAEGR